LHQVSGFLKRLALASLWITAIHVGWLRAETGYEAWLRYAPLDRTAAAKYDSLPATAVVSRDSPVLLAARDELIRGVRGLLGTTLRAESSTPNETAIVLGTLNQLHSLLPSLQPLKELRDDGYWLTTAEVRGFKCLVITATTDRGVLYGVFTLLRKIALHEDLTRLDEQQTPYASIRRIDQWDNLNGTIERGYGGRSIFFENDAVKSDLSRVHDYARLLASLGINGCNVNNVNANPKMLNDDFLPQLGRIADVFRPWGVRLSISVDFSSPKVIGGLDTFDPLDPRVAAWWRAKIDRIYKQIPDFAGFVIKADSEGRLGPAAYNRTPADAANAIATALKPHGGLVFYRAFVYNHHLDWGDPKNDRARAAYDIFHPLDGKFEDNVIIQIKNGPIDFQVREPASPLFSGLEKTNEAIELQITQEYMGQQKHLCFLVPMWKEVLDFDMRAKPEGTPVREIIAGRTFHRPTGGFVGVANVGMNANWLGSLLAMANLYGFGRLAWNPTLSQTAIAEEWTRLMFGDASQVAQTIPAMLLTSWHAYENYTGPLGAGTLTNILGSHYGPGIESSERNGWGQWHRADNQGIGMDRTVATGTGYIGQYPPRVRPLYETLANCPDELLLFFHHVPYTYVLHSGKTVIQHIYDSHYEGTEMVKEYVRQWKLLKGHVDAERYAAILAQLEYQAGHARVWRDAVCYWFLRMSGIQDAKGRVGHYPNRIEAEHMELQGYAIVDVSPPEVASGGKAVECPPPAEACTAAFHFQGAPAWYDLSVQYFDQNNGVAHFRVFVNDQLIDEWDANLQLPATKIGGDSSTSHQITGVALRSDDKIRVEGAPSGEERAAVDYVELRKSAP
jgi:alpha-glucuronidase